MKPPQLPASCCQTSLFFPPRRARGLRNLSGFKPTESKTSQRSNETAVGRRWHVGAHVLQGHGVGEALSPWDCGWALMSSCLLGHCVTCSSWGNHVSGATGEGAGRHRVQVPPRRRLTGHL